MPSDCWGDGLHDVWVRADTQGSRGSRRDMVTSCLEAGVSSIVVREDDGLKGLGRFDAITVDGDSLMLDGDIVARVVDVSSPEDQDLAASMAGDVDVLIVDVRDWRVIPIENLIAALQGSGTRLFAVVRDVGEGDLFLETLERGVDGLLVETDDPSSIRGFLPSGSEGIDLTTVKVTGVRDVGMGDRVCLDTCSMMCPGEGMLVGSSSSCLFLVQSESEESGYVASRPFRVNAGAVHSYVMVPGGRTRYLSEMGGGDPALIVADDGTVREAVIGRSKLESRPLTLIEATDGESSFSVILQNAETVRMCSTSGSIPVSHLEEGDEVLALIGTGGRHFGMSVEETVRET